MKHIRYFIRLKGEHSSFCADRYSKYFDRLTAYGKGKLRGLVYGRKQARDHIAELRRVNHNGEFFYKDATFEIVREVTTTTVVETNSPQ